MTVLAHYWEMPGREGCDQLPLLTQIGIALALVPLGLALGWVGDRLVVRYQQKKAGRG